MWSGVRFMAHAHGENSVRRGRTRLMCPTGSPTEYSSLTAVETSYQYH
ncbi:hypothetical protein A2U01_0066930, partial [Trifolium medium]|nr:hypothetical protein [Trifolium medium]